MGGWWCVVHWSCLARGRRTEFELRFPNPIPFIIPGLPNKPQKSRPREEGREGGVMCARCSKRVLSVAVSACHCVFLSVGSLRSHTVESSSAHPFPQWRLPVPARAKTTHLCVASHGPELVAPDSHGKYGRTADVCHLSACNLDSQVLQTSSFSGAPGQGGSCRCTFSRTQLFLIGTVRDLSGSFGPPMDVQDPCCSSSQLKWSVDQENSAQILPSSATEEEFQTTSYRGFVRPFFFEPSSHGSLVFSLPEHLASSSQDN